MSNELITTGNDRAGAGADQPGSGSPSAGQNVSGRNLSRAEIERIRDTDIDRYFAERLDRELVRMTRAEMGKTEPTERLSPDESREQMMETPEGAELVMELERMGGFNTQLQRIQDAVDGLVRGLGDDRHQRRFMYDFDQFIPEPIRYRIYMQIALGPPSFVVPVSADEVKEFIDSGAAELVAEWGVDAATNIAKVWKKIAILKAEIGEDGMDTFKLWFEGLCAADAKAVVKFIAGVR